MRIHAGEDGRLDRLLEIATMVMEAFGDSQDARAGGGGSTGIRVCTHLFI